MARGSRLEPVASSPILRRFLGAPQAADASREERLRYVRRCTMLPLPSVALLWVVVLGFGQYPTWLPIVMGAGTSLSLASAVSLSFRILRAGSHGDDTSADPS